MDVAKFQNMKAVNMSKNKEEKKNITQLHNNFLLYSMIVLTCCSLFCSIGFPSLKVFRFQMAFPNSTSLVFLSSKFFFLVGNLIIIMVLIGESKSFSPKAPAVSDLYFEEYISRKRTPVKISSAGAADDIAPAAQEERENQEAEKVPFKENGQMEKKHVKKSSSDKGLRVRGVERDENGLLPAKELSKRADDFIARVNRQRKLEARTLLCYP